jgi:hypothetical protein
MDAERKGLPSASSMDRYNRCEASLPLERLLRKRGELPADQDSEAASHGRMIHSICEEMWDGREKVESRYAESDIQEASAYVAEARNIAMRAWGADDEGEVILEKRLFLKDDSKAAICTGQADVIWIRDTEALVLDYKTGWGALPLAADSYQLMTYAAMVAQEYGALSVRVAFIKQGRMDSEAILSKQELYELQTFVLPGLLSGRDENPFLGNFNPDPDGCKYCPCRLRCPALNAQYMIMEPDKTVEDIFLPSLHNGKLEEMKAALGKLGAFERALDTEMLARAKEDPGAFIEWHIAPGRGRRVVTDASALCEKLLADGVEPSEIYAAIKLSITDAEGLHKLATGLKGKMAKQDFESRYEDYVERKEGKPGLHKRN